MLQPSRGRPEYYRDRDVVKAYDARYRGGLGRWKHRRKARVLTRWLEEVDNILEVACGPGRFHAVCSDAVHLDRSPTMLQEYRSRHPQARLVVADASELPFGDNQFDAVMSIRFVSHLRGEFRRGVLMELARVSKRWVIIDARHRANARYWSRWIRVRLGLAKSDKLRHSSDEMRQELREAGLAVREIRAVAPGLSGRVLILAERI